MTSTKWTSRAVEGPNARRKYAEPKKEFPPRLRFCFCVRTHQSPPAKDREGHEFTRADQGQKKEPGLQPLRYPSFHPCHPERSMTPTKWTSCAVEEPAPSEAEGIPTPCKPSSAQRGISTKAQVSLLRENFTNPARESSGRTRVPLVPIRTRKKETVASAPEAPSFPFCHPERSMTSTKWTSCAVEGPLAASSHQHPQKEFPPLLRFFAARSVWDGHSCPSPLTLISLATLPSTQPEIPTPPTPRVKQRTLQRRVKHPK
jgi:hypothetical protein